MEVNISFCCEVKVPLLEPVRPVIIIIIIVISYISVTVDAACVEMLVREIIRQHLLLFIISL